MIAVLWTLAGTLAALVAALVALGWRHTRTVRSEAMLAARVEEQDKELERANKANLTQVAHNAALRVGLEQSLGDIDRSTANGLRGWLAKVDAAHSDRRDGAVLDQPAGASAGVITGSGDDHDTEPNGRRMGDDIGHGDAVGPAGSAASSGEANELGSGLRANLRGKR